MKNSQKIFAVR